MRVLFCFIFIAILASTLALTDEQKAKRDKISTECRKVSGVTEEVVLKARQGQISDDPNLKKQILCVAKKTGLATEAGDTNVEALKVQLKKVSENDEEVDQIVQKCVVKKDTPEETAFENFKCLLKSKPNLQVVN